VAEAAMSSDLFAELKRRRVFRAAMTYVGVSWVLVQIADTLGQALALPSWSLAMVMYLLALGFPLVLVLSWIFDVGPQGIVATPEVRRAPLSPTRLALLGGGLVVATFAVFLLLRYTSGAAPRAVQADETASLGAARSIAVLPFADLSAESDQRWFADGLTEDLMSGLARSPELMVAARTSAARLRDADVRQVGRELGVATVLQGSVRRVGKQIRVSVQLIDARSGFQIWSQTYDGRIDDILALQGEVASGIARDLRTAFQLPEPRTARPTDDALEAAGEG
jgi:TolB-like protein